MVPNKVTGAQIEKLCGGLMAARIRYLARYNGGLAKTLHDVVAAGVEVLEANLAERRNPPPDPVATQPFEPRYAHITR